MEPRPKTRLDYVRDAIRLTHDSRHTEQAYVTWIKRYIFFHDKRHPKAMGAAEIEAFLTHLAVPQKVAASTHNQALSALLFLSRDVLRQPLDGPIDAIRARKPTRLPTVLTKEEALQVIGALSGTHVLMGKLLYGTGMRLMEYLRLRVKDLDFAQRQSVVRDGFGAHAGAEMAQLVLARKDLVPPRDLAITVPLVLLAQIGAEMGIVGGAIRPEASSRNKELVGSQPWPPALASYGANRARVKRKLIVAPISLLRPPSTSPAAVSSIGRGRKWS